MNLYGPECTDRMRTDEKKTATTNNQMTNDKNGAVCNQ